MQHKKKGHYQRGKVGKWYLQLHLGKEELTKFAFIESAKGSCNR